MFYEGIPARIGIVLGAGASRAVSYADEAEVPSPLDADFFDLLQRVEPGSGDKQPVDHIIKQTQKLPNEYWYSMERAFYTLHLRAYMRAKLTNEDRLAERVIKEFAQCVQVLLRKAHGKRTCVHHTRLLESLHEADTIISFNYDLVAERALKPIAEHRDIRFGRWLYSLTANTYGSDLPVVLKLHGSSNWKLTRPERTNSIEVRTTDWEQLDETPGYRGHIGEGTAFPIFLPFWDKRIERQPGCACGERPMNASIKSKRSLSGATPFHQQTLRRNISSASRWIASLLSFALLTLQKQRGVDGVNCSLQRSTSPTHVSSISSEYRRDGGENTSTMVPKASYLCGYINAWTRALVSYGLRG
jgi:hypothetical protein